MVYVLTWVSDIEQVVIVKVGQSQVIALEVTVFEFDLILLLTFLDREECPEAQVLL